MVTMKLNILKKTKIMRVFVGVTIFPLVSDFESERKRNATLAAYVKRLFIVLKKKKKL